MSYKKYSRIDYDKPNGFDPTIMVPHILLYQHMLGYKPPIGKSISSPFREDGNPSFAFYYAEDGNLLWKDFATGEAGNVLTFATRWYSCNTKEAKILLSKGFYDYNGPSILPSTRSSLRRKKNIQIEPKNWSPTTLKYWEQYGLDTETLNKFNVRPIESYLVNELPSKFRWSDYEPMYAYRVYKRYKIYRPLSQKSNKWRTNLTKYDLFGFEQLPKGGGDTLIITKSLKDVMVLYKLGYTAVGTMNEGALIPDKVMDYLKDKWNNIYLFFDNDLPGREFAKRMAKKYSLPYFYLPLTCGAKDISDYLVLYGKDKAKIEIERMLQNVE